MGDAVCVSEEQGRKVRAVLRNLAEGVGIEPTVSFPTSVFKTDAIDHSATPPGVLQTE